MRRSALHQWQLIDALHLSLVRLLNSIRRSEQRAQLQLLKWAFCRMQHLKASVIVAVSLPPSAALPSTKCPSPVDAALSRTHSSSHPQSLPPSGESSRLVGTTTMIREAEESFDGERPPALVEDAPQWMYKRYASIELPVPSWGAEGLEAPLQRWAVDLDSVNSMPSEFGLLLKLAKANTLRRLSSIFRSVEK